MSDNHLGILHNSDGWNIVGPDGYSYPAEPEYLQELGSAPSTPALDVPTIDVEPEMVRDNEFRPEIEGR